jgi:DnaJ-class molecular chaperone
MLINIVDVGAPNTHAAKNGRSYQSIEVTYKNDLGQTQSKKLMSFSNPTVFNHIKDLNKGDLRSQENPAVNITSPVKGFKGYPR